METGRYMRIRVGDKWFPIRQENIRKVLMEPMITRIPGEKSILYGVLYDGQDMVPLLDLSSDLSVREEGYGRMCVLMERNLQKLAVVISEIQDITGEIQDEENWDDEDIFRVFFQEVMDPNENTGG